MHQLHDASLLQPAERKTYRGTRHPGLQERERSVLEWARKVMGRRQEAGESQEAASPLKRTAGTLMASSTVKGGRDRDATENGRGGTSAWGGQLEVGSRATGS